MKNKLWALIIAAGIALTATGAVRPDNDAVIFEKKCSLCHATKRVFDINKTMFGWDKTVDWMRRKGNNPFSDNEAAAIKRRLRILHPDYPGQLFQQRCSRCHPLEATQQLRLSPAQWRMLVNRERKKAITWIALDEIDDIAGYLAAQYPLDAAGVAALENSPQWQTRLRIEQKCLRCHIHKTVFKPVLPYEQWVRINERMQGKSPSLISAGDIAPISQFLSEHNPREEWE